MTEEIDRVRLALHAQARGGVVERWSASRAYAQAALPAATFEGLLAVLEHAGEIGVMRTPGGRRRFDVRRLRRPFVPAVPPAASRTVRVSTIVPAPGHLHARWRFRLEIEGVGAIEECVYVRGERSFVAGPSRRVGVRWVPIVKLTDAIAQAALEAVERHLAAFPAVDIAEAAAPSSRPHGAV